LLDRRFAACVACVRGGGGGRASGLAGVQSTEICTGALEDPKYSFDAPEDDEDDEEDEEDEE